MSTLWLPRHPPLATQIHRAVRDAIETGRLDPGADLGPVGL